MLSQVVQDALNDQINTELYSSYNYLAMSAWCERQNFRGCANWLRVQSQEEYAHAMKLKESEGLTFVHPYDDPDVIAGQGTIGMELLRQCSDPLHAIFVAVGGGDHNASVGMDDQIGGVLPSVDHDAAEVVCVYPHG